MQDRPGAVVKVALCQIIRLAHQILLSGFFNALIPLLNDVVDSGRSVIVRAGPMAEIDIAAALVLVRAAHHVTAENFRWLAAERAWQWL
jgi:hypothetical protein